MIFRNVFPSGFETLKRSIIATGFVEIVIIMSLHLIWLTIVGILKIDKAEI